MEPRLESWSGPFSLLGRLGPLPWWQAGGLPPCPTAAAADSGALRSPTLAVWRERTQGRALIESIRGSWALSLAGRPDDGTPSVRPQAPSARGHPEAPTPARIGTYSAGRGLRTEQEMTGGERGSHAGPEFITSSQASPLGAKSPHAPMVTVSLEEPALAPACTLVRAPYWDHLLELVQRGCLEADFHTAIEPALAQAHADLATYLATILVGLFDPPP